MVDGAAQPSKDLRRTAFLFMDVGLLALVLAGILVVKTALAANGRVETTGTIVYDGRTHQPKRDRIRVQYTVGEEILQIEDSLASRSSLQLGDNVAVLYAQEDPRRAQLAENLWAFPALVIVLGLGTMGYSVFLRKKADREDDLAARRAPVAQASPR